MLKITIETSDGSVMRKYDEDMALNEELDFNTIAYDMINTIIQSNEHNF